MTRRILSIDGGGLRGVFSAAVIEQMEKVMGIKAAADGFDCFVGSSAGAMIAAGLASGRPAGDIKQTFIKLGKELSEVMGAGGAAREATQLLTTILQDMFGKNTRAEDLEKRFAVTTRDMAAGKVVFFGNIPRDQIDSASFWSASGTIDDDPPVWEMVLRSAALPPIFEPAGNYLDGGVSPFANPSYAACIGVQRCLGWVPSDEILQCFSVGTGYHTAAYDLYDDAGNVVQDTQLFSDMVGAMMQDINFLQHQIMKRRRSQRLTYKRFNLAFNTQAFERAGIPLEMAMKDGKLIFDTLAMTATPEVSMLARIGSRLAQNRVRASDFDAEASAANSPPYTPFAAEHPRQLESLQVYPAKPSASANLYR